MTKPADLTTPHMPNWCPGCGDMAIWAAFKNACVANNWNNTNTALVAGIGCHGHILNFIKLTGFEGLHGRPLPAATGIKLTNSRLNVFVFTGDGDSLAEGGNHFVHACRRSHNLTVIVHDNAIYGLTTGQTSPMSPLGMKSKSTPLGNPDNPISPATLAIASGATFVARAYASDIPTLADLITKANAHNGMAVIDVMQPCVTFNKVCTHTFFQQNTYKLGPDYDPTNKEHAFAKSLEWGEKAIPLGILYLDETKPSYEDHVKQIAEKPLIDHVASGRKMDELFRKYS